jgi:hypothetical protein
LVDVADVELTVDLREGFLIEAALEEVTGASTATAEE